MQINDILSFLPINIIDTVLRYIEIENQLNFRITSKKYLTLFDLINQKKKICRITIKKDLLMFVANVFESKTHLLVYRPILFSDITASYIKTLVLVSESAKLINCLDFQGFIALTKLYLTFSEPLQNVSTSFESNKLLTWIHTNAILANKLPPNIIYLSCSDSLKIESNESLKSLLIYNIDNQLKCNLNALRLKYYNPTICPQFESLVFLSYENFGGCVDLRKLVNLNTLIINGIDDIFVPINLENIVCLRRIFNSINNLSNSKIKRIFFINKQLTDLFAFNKLIQCTKLESISYSRLLINSKLISKFISMCKCNIFICDAHENFPFITQRKDFCYKDFIGKNIEQFNTHKINII